MTMLALAQAATRAVAEPLDSTPLPAQLNKRDPARLRDYKTFLAFYERGASPRRHPHTTLREVIPQYPKATTLKTASYVQAGFQVSVQPLGDAQETAARAAELALDEIALNNQLDLLDYASEIDASVMGDGCFRVTWDPIENRVAIIAPDVAGIFPWVDPLDPMRFRRVAHRYRLSSADIIATWPDIVTPPRNDPETVVEDWTDSAHMVWIGDDNRPGFVELNPYGTPPFIIYPNQVVPKQWWGASDMAPMVAIVDEIVRETSRLANLMDLSGNPITILEGVDSTDDGANVQAFAGAIWELPEKARAYVLDLLRDGATQQHLAYIERALSMFHDTTETPKTAFGGNEKELSGIALEVDLQPLLQKVARKRTIRGIAYAARAQLALEIHDANTGSDHANAGTPTVSWQAPTPRDRQREVATEALLVNARITSHETAIGRLGDPDPQAELARIKQELADGLFKNDDDVDSIRTPA